METVANILNPNENNNNLSGKEISELANKIFREGGAEALDEFVKKETARRAKEEKEKKQTAPADKKSNIPEKNHFSPSPADKPRPVPDITSGAGSLSDNIEGVLRKAPVDKSSAPTVRPQSIHEAMSLLQPKSVVFGKYQLTEWQENILTLIMEQLQGYMSRSMTNLRPDILGEVTVRVDCSQIAGDDKKKAIEQLEKLMEYKFEFWWQNKLAPAGTKKVETKGLIIQTIHNYVGTSYVDIVINKWAFPFLLYYGQGVGANQFIKHTALILPGKYAKRLYKILSGYIDKGQFDYRISMMRENFQIPPSYTNATIKRSIIKPAVENINAIAKEISVDFEFVVIDDGKNTPKGKKEFNAVRFWIKKNGQPERTHDEGKMVSEVVQLLSPYLDEPYRTRLYSIANTWRNHGDISLVHSKVIYYTSQISSGKMTPLKAKNYMIKAIEDETHTELRKTRRKKVKDDE